MYLGLSSLALGDPPQRLGQGATLVGTRGKLQMAIQEHTQGEPTIRGHWGLSGDYIRDYRAS